MSVSEILDRCRAVVPGCQLVAFIDLDSSMVLAVSSHSKQRQERLDTLGATASKLLPMRHDDPAERRAQSGDADPQVAVLLTMTETTAIVRSQTEPQEALCICCSPNSHVETMIGAAGPVLSDIDGME